MIDFAFLGCSIDDRHCPFWVATRDALIILLGNVGFKKIMVVKSEKAGQSRASGSASFQSRRSSQATDSTLPVLLLISSAASMQKRGGWVSRLKASVELRTMETFLISESDHCRPMLSSCIIGRFGHRCPRVSSCFCRAASIEKVYTPVSQSAAFFPDWLISPRSITQFDESSESTLELQMFPGHSLSPGKSRGYLEQMADVSNCGRSCHAKLLIYER